MVCYKCDQAAENIRSECAVTNKRRVRFEYPILDSEFKIDKLFGEIFVNRNQSDIHL